MWAHGRDPCRETRIRARRPCNHHRAYSPTRALT
jgi:hypothetical protein